MYPAALGAEVTDHEVADSQVMRFYTVVAN